MITLLGFPLAAAMLAACLWVAVLVASRLTALAAPHVRLSAAALVALWLQVVVFLVLGHLHLFRLVVAAPLWIVSAALAHHRLGGDRAFIQLVNDLGAARAAFVEVIRAPVRALLFVIGLGIASSRLLRDLVSPPLAWDAFLYHLYNPARWIQHAGLVTERAPDGWGYLEYFPAAGDVTWSWAMLPIHGDALVAPAGVLVWATCLLGAYSLCRALGAARVEAGLASMAVGFIPAAANIMTSSYTDDFVLAVFLLSGVFLVQLAEPSRESTVPTGPAALAGAGLGLLASAKLSGLPALGLGLLFIAVLVSRTGPHAARFRAIGLAVLLAALVAAPGYLRAWIEAGSPFYPLTVSVGGKTLFAGNEELQLLYTGRLLNLSAIDDSLLALLRVLAIPVYDVTCEHGGFGYGVIGLVAVAPFGLWPLLRERRTRAVTLFLLVAAIVPFFGLLTSGFIAHRTLWRGVIGRLILPLPAMLAVVAARASGRFARWAWVPILVLSYAASLPQSFSAPAVAGMIRIAAPLTLGVMVSGGIALGLHRLGRPGWGAITAMLMFASVIAWPVSQVRADLRYPIYGAHDAPRPAYQIHRLEPTYASSWTIWRALDDGAPHRIALAAGWDGIGHNWFRYPLVGSRLQNEVIYVPFTRDGSVVDYRLQNAAYANADYDAWLSRLVEQRVDSVVILYPWPIEQTWMEANPGLFERVSASTEGYNLAYRLHRERLPGVEP